MHITSVILLFFMLFPGLSFAEELTTQAQVAAKYYDSGNYPSAIFEYKMIIDAGLKNPYIFYNMGNSYFKTGNIGKAILYYEKASRLCPSDPDIRFNLAFARTAAGEPDENFLGSLNYFFTHIISLYSSLLLCLFCYLALALGLVTFFLKGFRTAFTLNVLFLFLVIVFSFIVILQLNEQVINKYAITTSAQINAKNGPEAGSSFAFSIPEGRKVLVLGEQDEWYAIKLEKESLSGWSEKSNFELIQL